MRDKADLRLATIDQNATVAKMLLQRCSRFAFKKGGGDKDERWIFEMQQSINKSKLTNKSATCNPTGVKAAPSPETIVLAYLALKSV